MSAGLKRSLLAVVLAAGALSLAGCIVEPAGGGYGGGYYAEPAPVYVGPSFYYGPRYGYYGGGYWHGGGYHHGGHWH